MKDNKKIKKRFGDRKDATKVRDIDGLHKLMLRLKPRRSSSDVYINHSIDVTELVKYIEKKKLLDKNVKTTYFHAFSTAIAKMIYTRPGLNRFVINGDFYDRNEVALSFVAKTELNDEAEECMAVIKVEENANINTIRDIISGKVKKIRDNSKKNDTDHTIELVGKMPKFLRAFIMWIFKKLDNHDMLPSSLTKDDIYHSTILLSNLGSIECVAIYHNLTDFGTNSIIITIGSIYKKPIVDKNGKTIIRDMCDFGATLDERIGDGVYFVKSLKILEYILANPILLEEAVSKKVKINKGE